MTTPMRLTNPLASTADGPAKSDDTASVAQPRGALRAAGAGMLASDRAFAFDNISEGLASGRFGGAPLSGNYPSALIAILIALDWEPDVRALAGAMPHVPQDFDLFNLRAILERLGYASELRRLKGRELARRTEVTLVTDRRHGLRLVTGQGNGAVLRCPEGGEAKPIIPGRTYNVVVFKPAPELRSEDLKEGWTGRLWRRFTPQLGLLAGLIFLSNLLVIVASLWIMAIFDTAIPAQAIDTLGMFVVGLAAVFALDVWLRRIRARLISRITGRLEFVLGSALFAKLMSFPVSMLTSSSISDQISRLKQFETIRDFFNGPVVAVLLELPFLIVLIFAIGVINPVLAGISLCFVLFFGAVVVFLYARISRASAALSRCRTEHLRLTLETLARRERISSMGLAEVWTARVAKEAAKAVDARLVIERHNRLLSTLTTLATPLSGGTVLLIGAALVMEGQMSGGQLVAVTILVWRLLAPVQQALLVAVRAPELSMLFKQIDALMRIDPRSASARSALVRQLEPRLDIENLVVRYPRVATPALAGVSLSLKPGQMMVVDGPSGGGKTTLLRAIAGQYAPQAGSVRVGGTNIQQIAASDLAEKIGYITNQSLVFHGTVAQNLFLAAPAARMTDLRDVAQELGILDQILDLPEGFDTRLDHAQQARITGGLRTMIAAAQVLLRSPGIILFDAPSVPLSPSEEAQLIDALKARSATTTVVLVSDNPAVMQRADLRLVLIDGRIRSFGPTQVNT